VVTWTAAGWVVWCNGVNEGSIGTTVDRQPQAYTHLQPGASGSSTIYAEYYEIWATDEVLTDPEIVDFTNVLP
jgi:hypothetical protein